MCRIQSCVPYRPHREGYPSGEHAMEWEKGSTSLPYQLQDTKSGGSEPKSKGSDVLQSCHAYDPNEVKMTEYSGVNCERCSIPEEIMIRSPLASSFSKALTCASPRSRTSTQHKHFFARSSCDLPPASGRRTTLAQSRADVFRDSIAATSWRMGWEDHLVSQNLENIKESRVNLRQRPVNCISV